jgi:hypothetical protein
MMRKQIEQEELSSQEEEMNRNCLLSLFLLGILALSGCKTYNYRIVEPADAAQTISDRPVTIRYDPLEYRMVRRRDRLAMRIVNTTDDRMVLRGDRSFVIDAKGETHPVQGRVIGPHSFTRIILPPVPLSYQTVQPYPYYGWGWGTGFAQPPFGYSYPYSPFFGGGFYDDFYNGPLVTNYEIRTPYDWKWRTGPVRLHLTYDRDGRSFDHSFVIDREPERK